MNLFVGYGYNPCDQWIEDDVFPILGALGFNVVHGKSMHGEVLQDGVKKRIDRCDGLIGFCTIRKGQEDAAFNTHPWVRDEMVYALARPIPVIEVREKGVANPPGLVGDRQRIEFAQDGRLGCVRELVSALASWNVRQIQLIPHGDLLLESIRKALKDEGFRVRYRVMRDGIDSEFYPARVSAITGGLYMTARGLADSAYIEVEGRLNGQLLFSSGWEAVDAVQVVVR